MHASMAFNFPSLPSIAEEVTRQERDHSEHEYQTIDQESSPSCQQILLLSSSVFFGPPAKDQSKSMINRVSANLMTLIAGKDSKFVWKMVGITCILGIAFFLGFVCGNPHFLESLQHHQEGTFFLDKQFVMNLTRLENFRQVKIHGIEAMVDVDLVCSPRITLPNSCPDSRANITAMMKEELILHYLDGIAADVQLILNALEIHGMSNGFTAARVDLKHIASFVQP